VDADALRELRCIGDATPTPEWRSYLAGAAIPAACASGVPEFASAAPDVHVIDDSFESPRSWRANLAYASATRWFRFTLNGILSLNLDQRSTTDLNLEPRPDFTLADDGRGVFAPPASIVTESGLIAPGASRVDSRFGQVRVDRSDLRSVARQLTVQVAPAGAAYGWAANATYTLSSTRVRTNGFEDPTAGDPRVRFWTPGAAPRHQFILARGRTIGPAMVSLYSVIQSGERFTPVIDRDVNGDGLPNDRAFVPRTAGAQDSELSRDVASLLRSAPRRIRRCLGRQAGSIASANSCAGPWTATANASVRLEGTPRALGHRRTSLRIDVINALAGLDLLTHGSRRLHGWGAPANVSPVLYRVRGFDATRRAFVYEVDPGFGRTSRESVGSRTPLGLTATLSIDLSRPYAEQQLDRALRPGRKTRGARLTVDQLKRGYARILPDPYRQLLAFTDSLLLSAQQVELLQAAQARYLAHMDTVWTGLSVSFANLPNDYDASAALGVQERTIDDAAAFTRLDVRRVFDAVLTPIQRRMLPSVPRNYYGDRLSLRSLRIGSPF
jgi:hypothetical protein